METKTSKLSTKSSRPKLKKSIIDCDIHHYFGMDVLKPYLPRVYREMIETYGEALPRDMHFNGGVGGRMVDSLPSDGSPAGSDLNYMREHHLDPHHVEYGILTGEHYRMQATMNYD